MDLKMIRIFIKFRTNQVPYPAGIKDVADAACRTALGREFDYQRDFLHSQGEICSANAPCHVLIDCEYHQSASPKNVTLHCYAVEDGGRDNGQLLVPRL
ncbi:hypothetical protein DM02DRAFT_331499 [Periconia macrospinosa]|uniref:Uncharacterized protein n=1 Tax=Periconia macrospinosa TaxID=97972 RepID=A0A2V1D202_9PLEO|nr:hypothetical protein DM02DRAFT_331499 [Periconia macrospinosa]